MEWKNLAITLVLLGGSGWAAAQNAPTWDRPPRAVVAERFENSAPQIGESLPDFQLFDAAGQPFRLSSLKGSYTVLVLGCLT